MCLAFSTTANFNTPARNITCLHISNMNKDRMMVVIKITFVQLYIFLLSHTIAGSEKQIGDKENNAVGFTQ